MLTKEEKSVLSDVIDEQARNNPVVGIKKLLADLGKSDSYARELIAEYISRRTPAIEQELVELEEQKTKLASKLTEYQTIGEM